MINWQDKMKIVMNFPQKGIKFYDLLPILIDPYLFRSLVDELSSKITDKINTIVTVGARGFLFFTPVALKKNIGIIPVRKLGKLPGEVYSVTYQLEYASTTLVISKSAFDKNKEYNVIICDDVAATGNTFIAIKKLLDNFPNVKCNKGLTILHLDFFNSQKLVKGIDLELTYLKNV